MELKDKIKEFRLSQQLSQEELAQKLKVSYQTVGRWERGDRKPGMLQMWMLEKNGFKE